MNAENIPTPNERKKELTNMDYEYNIVSSETRKNPTWTNGTVTDMLSNENYTGTYVFNMQEKSVLTPGSFKFHPKEEWGRVYNHHEAIISQEEFDKVQAIKVRTPIIPGDSIRHFKALLNALLVTTSWDLFSQKDRDLMEA